MKKSILLLVLNFLFLFSVSAQNNQGTTTGENAEKTTAQGNQKDSVNVKKNQKSSDNNGDERKNFFLGGGVRANVYVNNNAKDFDVWKKPTFGGSVFVGKWFNQYLGSRINLEVGQFNPYFQKMKMKEKENYFSGRLDVMFDVTNCIRSYAPDNFYNLIPYFGIGGAHAFNAANSPDKAKRHSSFLFGGGLLNTFRLSDKLSAFLNLGFDVVDAKFDGSKNERKFNGLAATSIGVVYDF